MRWPVLVRRRKVWVPTVWAWLLIFITGAGGFLFAGRHAHSFLAPNQPVGGCVLVVEGWMPPGELDQAVEVIRKGRYEHVITTGGPVEGWLERVGHSSYAGLARDYLMQHGVPGVSVTAVSAPASDQDRTYLSALTAREWLRQSDYAVEALDVLSSGVHSRRTWSLYRLAFGSHVSVGIIAARPTTYESEAWWRTSAGAKAVVAEAINWVWTEIFFRPGIETRSATISEHDS